jgi:hypothetical protein
LKDDIQSRRLFSRVTVIIVIAVSTYLSWALWREVQRPSQNTQWEVAEALSAYVSPNNTVACIGYSFDCYWAHLARVRLIAEVPAGIEPAPTEADKFWTANHEKQQSVLDALAATGARAVVAVKPPKGADLRGWYCLGSQDYYVHALSTALR